MDCKSWMVSILFAVALLAGCGGGSDSSAPPASQAQAPSAPPPNATAGGIWEGFQYLDGAALEILGLITEAGEFHFIREDGVQFVGMLSVRGNAGSGSYEAAVPLGYVFEDGSQSGGGSIQFTIVERQTLTGSYTFTSERGNTLTGTVSLSFDAVYSQSSSLSRVAGTYTNAFEPGSDAVAITSDGALFYQDGSGTGCVANGRVETIDTRFNAYRLSFQFGNCTGRYAVLNGAGFSGIGTLDTTGTRETLVAGVTGIVGNLRLAIVYFYERT